jgi:hypothetical protein
MTSFDPLDFEIMERALKDAKAAVVGLEGLG